MSYLFTLKLDASWRPIEVVDAYNGFSLVFSGRAQVVENYSHLACALFYFPSVVVLNSYVRKQSYGASPSRNTVFFRDSHQCQYCTDFFSKGRLTLDHVIPKSRGGLKSWENLSTCCVPCNQRKGDKTPSEASMELIREPCEPNWNLWSSIEWMTRKHGIKKIPETWDKFLGDGR